MYIASVRYPAKVTQSAYGICKYAAILSILKYSTIVLMISASSSNNHINARRYAPKLKNIMLQAKLTIKLEA